MLYSNWEAWTRLVTDGAHLAEWHRLKDAALSSITRRIASLELPPGAHFREAELAQQLGIGRTPVREALLALRQQGLVVVEPGVGYSVAPVEDIPALWRLARLLFEEARSRPVASSPMVVASVRAAGPAIDDVLLDYSEEAVTRYVRGVVSPWFVVVVVAGDVYMGATAALLLTNLERSVRMALDVLEEQGRYPPPAWPSAVLASVLSGDEALSQDLRAEPDDPAEWVLEALGLAPVARGEYPRDSR